MTSVFYWYWHWLSGRGGRARYGGSQKFHRMRSAIHHPRSACHTGEQILPLIFFICICFLFLNDILNHTSWPVLSRNRLQHQVIILTYHTYSPISGRSENKLAGQLNPDSWTILGMSWRRSGANGRGHNRENGSTEYQKPSQEGGGHMVPLPLGHHPGRASSLPTVRFQVVSFARQALLSMSEV